MLELSEGGEMAKVLLIEDNEMNRDMLSRRLIRRGFQVVFAMDGQQGIDLARSERPDIILMDLGLPVIDGSSRKGENQCSSDGLLEKDLMSR